MSVEDEKKKSRKAPAKKGAATASSGDAGEKKVKAAPAKSSPAKKKTAVKSVSEEQQVAPEVEHARQTAAPVAGRREPTHFEIAELAHTYFVERGHQHGFHEHDWYRAERELRAKLS
jgi:hypothetical protein